MASVNILFKIKIIRRGTKNRDRFRNINFRISSTELDKSVSQLAQEWHKCYNQPNFYRDLFVDFKCKFPELGDKQKKFKLASIGKHFK